MTITINGVATADIGFTNDTICEGSDYFLNSTTATNYSSLFWITGGTGYFNNDEVLNPAYSPSADDIANGTVTLTFTAVGNAPCSNATSTITLIINRQSTAYAGVNATICEGSTYTVSTATATHYTSLLWTTTGTGTLTNANTLTPTYTPAAGETGIITLTLTAGSAVSCFDSVSSMTLTINGLAAADVGTNGDVICEGSDYSLSLATASNYSGVLWTTTGTGTFNNPTSVQPIYSPSNADISNGGATLTLTAYGNAPCLDAVSSMLLNISRQAVVSAGANTTICEGNTFTVSSATAVHYTSLLWTTTGTGTLTNDNTLTPTYTPAVGETGTITLTLTATSTPPCVDAVSTMSLTINLAALASTGIASDVICEGSNYPLASATASNYSSLLWTTSGTGTFNNPAALQPIYTPSTADIFAGGANLTLTAYGLNACGNAVSTMTLNISRQAVVNAGLNATICEGNTFTVSTAYASYATALIWSSTGTGTITNETTITPTYTPGAGETGTVILTLTANSTAPCVDATSSMTLTINGTATADVGIVNDVICEGSNYPLASATATNYSGILWTTSGTGTFNNPTVLQPIYTPSIADINTGNVILTLTAYGLTACSNAISTMTLNISRQSIVYAGVNATICATGSYTVNTATANHYTTLAWTTSGTGTITNGTTLTPTYTPGAGETGVITLTLTASSTAPCIDATSTMSLTINGAAIASTGIASDVICEGSNYHLNLATASNYSGILWTTSGTGTFSNPSAIQPIYTPSIADINAGSVNLTITAYGLTSCGDADSTMTLNISRQAIANAGINAGICIGNSFTVSTATATHYSSLLWTTSGTGAITNGTTLTPTYNPGAGETGNVTLTLTASSTPPCIDAVSSMTITIYPQATAFAGPDTTICETSGYFTIPATASNYSSLMWTTTGTGTFGNPSLLHTYYTPGTADITTGTVKLILHAYALNACIDAIDTMVLNISRLPVIYAGPNGQTCQDVPYSLASATSLYSTSVAWTTTGDGTFNDSTLINAIYTPGNNDAITGTVTLTLTGHGSYPCVDVIDQMILSVTANPTLVCPGNIVQNTLPGSCQIYVTVPQPTLSSTAPCVVSVTNNFTGTENASGTYPVGVNQVVWTAVYASGSTSSCTQTVTIHGSPLAVDDSVSTPMNVPIVINILANDIDCDSNLNPGSVTIISLPTHGTVVINLITGEANYTPDSAYFGPDQFDYQVCDSNGLCSIATVYIDVLFVSNPLLVIAKAVSKIEQMSNGTFNIIYIVTAQNRGNEVLTGVQITDDLTATFPLPVTFTVVDPPYSNSSLMSNTNYDGRADINLLDSQASFLNVGELATITFTVNVEVFGAAQTFNNIAVGKARGQSGTQVSDSSNNGYECELGKTEPTPATLSPPDLAIPQGFSPNGDGYNDFFEIPGVLDYPDNVFTVFNRWGDKIYEMKGYDNSWDGKPNSNVMLLGRDKVIPGTYYYIFEFNKNDKKPKNGFIVIKY
jgi:gliding motility-associated-like protein